MPPGPVPLPTAENEANCDSACSYFFSLISVSMSLSDGIVFLPTHYRTNRTCHAAYAYHKGPLKEPECKQPRLLTQVLSYAVLLEGRGVLAG